MNLPETNINAKIIDWNCNKKLPVFEFNKVEQLRVIIKNLPVFEFNKVEQLRVIIKNLPVFEFSLEYIKDSRMLSGNDWMKCNHKKLF